MKSSKLGKKKRELKVSLVHILARNNAIMTPIFFFCFFSIAPEILCDCIMDLYVCVFSIILLCMYRSELQWWILNINMQWKCVRTCVCMTWISRVRGCSAIFWSFRTTTFFIRSRAIKVSTHWVSSGATEDCDSLMLFRFTPHNLLMETKLKLSDASASASASDLPFQWIKIIMSFAMLDSRIKTSLIIYNLVFCTTRFFLHTEMRMRRWMAQFLCVSNGICSQFYRYEHHFYDGYVLHYILCDGACIQCFYYQLM